GAGESLGELEDVAEVGPAEAINALRIISHDHHVSVNPGESAHELSLQPVRVLVFIYKHVTASGTDEPLDVFVGFENLHRATPEVVVVRQTVMPFVFCIR